MGEWDAATSTEPLPAVEFIVSRIFVHPQFTAANLRNNIAILRLSTPVQLGQVPTITTACLPSTVVTGIRCWVAGEIKLNLSNLNTGLVSTFYCFNYNSFKKKGGAEMIFQTTELIRRFRKKSTFHSSIRTLVRIS